MISLNVNGATQAIDADPATPLLYVLRDNLGLIASSAEIEPLAGQVEDSGGVYFVPAFSGLFAPHWRADARGVRRSGLLKYPGS